MGTCHEISLGWQANEERQRLESFRKHPLHRHVPLICEHSTEMYRCRLPLPDYARRQSHEPHRQLKPLLSRPRSRHAPQPI